MYTNLPHKEFTRTYVTYVLIPYIRRYLRINIFLINCKIQFSCQSKVWYFESSVFRNKHIPCSQVAVDILHGGGGGGRGGWKGDSNFTLLLTDRDEELDFTKVLMTYIQYVLTYMCWEQGKNLLFKKYVIIIIVRTQLYYVNLHVNKHKYMYADMQIHVHTQNTRSHMHHVDTCTCIGKHAQTHTHTYVYKYVYMNVCIYAHKHCQTGYVLHTLYSYTYSWMHVGEQNGILYYGRLNTVTLADKREVP